ncbi:MAG: choice-of-anchor Q domain-containing protein [Kofleriaceae bacterium]
MSSLTHIRLLLLVASFCSGCEKTNPSYCPGANPNNNCLDDGGGSGRCSTNAECGAPTAICDVTGTMTCVECLPNQAAACGGATPACGDDHACRGCIAHVECASSNACLPDGSCADEAQVAYVAGGGSGTQCTRLTPCGTLAAGLTTMRTTIKIVTGTVKDTDTTTINGRAVTIVADPGAKLDRDGDGVILEVRSNGADVKIFDLAITGQTGIADSAISVVPNGGAPKLSLTRVNISGNQGVGTSSTGGTLTVRQSTISANQAGGIAVSGVGATFDITNSYIFRNGDNSGSAFGGLNLGIAVAGTNRLAFNTIIDNEAAINSGGVACNVATFVGPNNIIARNQLAGSTTGVNAQTSGPCTYPTSKVQSDVAGLAFEHPDVPAPFSYKLTTGSTAIDQATTAVPIEIDHEGDPRPQGTAKDIGADEVAP